MKILRLSLFNIKKHKKEAGILVVLIAISIALMSVALINYSKSTILLEQALVDSGSKGNMFIFNEDSYRNEFADVIKNDKRVSDLEEFEIARGNNNAASSLRREDGSLVNFFVSFVTEENEKKISDFKKETTLSDEEIKELEHPIWLPYYAELDMRYKAGDTITLVIGGKDYDFDIAGFYESVLLSNAYFSYKCVVSKEDYDEFAPLMGRNIGYAYNLKKGVTDTDANADKYVEELSEKFNELAGREVTFSYNPFDCLVYEEEQNADVVKIMMVVVAFISIIVMISSLFMIRHKITNDIDDQMQQIGVLEALGYKSFQISVSYIYEYFILGVIGALLGSVLTFLADPAMTKVLQGFEGHKAKCDIDINSIILPAFAMIILVIVIALLRARSIKKYPPVIAFRKGIKTHHFGKNVLPIHKSHSDINIRIGLRDVVSNKRQNLGILLCILMAAISIGFCVLVADIFRGGGSAFESIAGWENGDLYLEFADNVPSEEIREELSKMEEVRKCNVIYTSSVVINDKEIQALVYKDYDETENVFTSKGRLPIHDNEFALRESTAEKLGIKIGDSVKIKGRGVEKEYILTGYSKSFATACYFTLDGINRILPPVTSGLVNVYLKDGVNVDDFRSKLKDLYGKSSEELMDENDETGSYEDRIRKKAEEQMALLMTKYGVNNMNYAIKIGDKVISGGTSRITLRNISSFDELVGAQLTSTATLSQTFSVIMMVIVAIIVSIIINFLISATIRKQRRELGIEKAMGYTTADIKKQMVFRIIPIAIPALIIGGLITIPLINIFMEYAFGLAMDVRLIILVPAMLVMALYIYASAYISAGKVKKISVTELMTE